MAGEVATGKLSRADLSHAVSRLRKFEERARLPLFIAMPIPVYLVCFDLVLRSSIEPF